MSERLQFFRALLENSGKRTGCGAVVTSSMHQVSKIVARLASAKHPMPNNPILGNLAGGKSRSSALRALRRLVAANIITIERQGSHRRCTFIATGHVTDWGEARPGHAPYLHRRPGEPKLFFAKVRRPSSRSLPTALPGSGAPPAVTAADRCGVVLGPARTCQYPLWADGQRVRLSCEPAVCAKPSRSASSYCDFHHIFCYRNAPSSVTGQVLDKRSFQASTRPKGLDL